MTKVLVFNSSPEKNRLLAHAFKALEQKNFAFSLLSSKKSPLGQFKFLFLLINFRLKRKVDLIICFNFDEKIIITPLARLLGLKVVWLEGPELNYRKFNKFLLALYKLNYRLAEIIVFNNYSKLKLKNIGCAENKISLIAPGAKTASYQENIFNKLASAGRENFHRKYFTIGLVTALNQKQKIEAIFQAVKISLPVIPNIQLIIIGEGRERKNLSWLAKKMEIDNLIWLVGEQENMKKWLDSFDIFLALGENLFLDDYGNILEAMAACLPILAPRNIGLEDLIVENNTGSLIESDNSEMLARQIIKLHQDKRLRMFLGKNGRERVNRLFSMETMIEKLEQALSLSL
ncbi:glycosyltransferase family 4 protein [Candidatus Falkowbacteria bacterium]|nr:glycosyltransferase family 4 protein [Candidatus Falkowbacteria bacterium]